MRVRRPMFAMAFDAAAVPGAFAFELDADLRAGPFFVACAWRSGLSHAPGFDAGFAFSPRFAVAFISAPFSSAVKWRDEGLLSALFASVNRATNKYFFALK